MVCKGILKVKVNGAYKTLNEISELVKKDSENTSTNHRQLIVKGT